MNRIIEPVPLIGIRISVADVADAGETLEGYHSLFTPLLAAGSPWERPRVSAAMSICED
jgi:hypothetical protein